MKREGGELSRKDAGRPSEKTPPVGEREGPLSGWGHAVRAGGAVKKDAEGVQIGWRGVGKGDPGMVSIH